MTKALTALLLVTWAVAPHPQAPEPVPAFEVTSIKPSPSNSPPSSISRPGLRVVAVNASVQLLITWAYDIRDDRLAAKPDWLDTVHYDVVGTFAREPARGDAQRMMQTLLKERFGLVVHHESRELPFYALVVTKGGPKVTLSRTPGGPSRANFSMSGAGRLAGTGASAAMLANVLSSQFERSVQDHTGLDGIFDFTLTWTPDGLAPGVTGGPSAPALVTALEEQLGMKIEPRRGPVDVIVIDRVNRTPTDN